MSIATVGYKNLIPYRRGCDIRRVGYAYLWSDMQKHLKEDPYPWEYYMFDPPILMRNPSDWGVTSQGLTWVEQNGVWHAIDWVGQMYYPNAADVMEEAFSGNGSGLLPLNDKEHIAKLTPQSRRLLVHPRGWLYNAREFKRDLAPIPGRSCILKSGKERTKHLSKSTDIDCASLHWQSVTDNWTAYSGEKRLGQVTVGDTKYTAARPPDGIVPKWGVAIIGWLPIDEIHIVDGDDKDRVHKALSMLQQYSQLPLYLTNV
jgi:hypothetical protein